MKASCNAQCLGEILGVEPLKLARVADSAGLVVSRIRDNPLRSRVAGGTFDGRQLTPPKTSPEER
jgi:hypothetical protein